MWIWESSKQASFYNFYVACVWNMGVFTFKHNTRKYELVEIWQLRGHFFRTIFKASHLAWSVKRYISQLGIYNQMFGIHLVPVTHKIEGRYFSFFRSLRNVEVITTYFLWRSIRECWQYLWEGNIEFCKKHFQKKSVFNFQLQGHLKGSWELPLHISIHS